MTSEEYLATRINELEQSERELKAKLKSFNALEPGRWVAWQEGYDQAHRDIEYMDPTPNPYRKDMDK
jgi:hypothetical protein